MLHYIDQGTGEAVVLLHGFCGSSEYWQNLIPKLSEKYRIIAPDLLGHGKSETPKGSLTIEDYADDILQLIDHLRIDKIILLGHSMGGYIALAFAEKYADRLHAFGLIHSTAYPDNEKGKAGRDKSVNAIQENGVHTFIDQLVPKLFAPKNVESMKDTVQLVKEIGYQTSKAGTIAGLLAMKSRIDCNHVLQQSDLPILLVAGEHDPLIAPEKTFVIKGEKIAQLLIRGAGHMSMYEDPEQLHIGIDQFLNFVLSNKQ